LFCHVVFSKLDTCSRIENDGRRGGQACGGILPPYQVLLKAIEKLLLVLARWQLRSLYDEKDSGEESSS
jgi:hypothetical protein